MDLKKNIFLIIFASLIGNFLRYFINNIYLISLTGSFLFGFIIAKRFKQSINRIFLGGFCSSYTTFSGFIYFFYKLINQGDILKIFIFLNLFIFLNILIMYFGFLLSRKIT